MASIGCHGEVTDDMIFGATILVVVFSQVSATHLEIGHQNSSPSNGHHISLCINSELKSQLL